MTSITERKQWVPNFIYRRFLFKIAEKMTQGDLKAAKFLIRKDALTGSDVAFSDEILKEATEATDFMELLESKNYLSPNNLFLLQYILWTIGRKDLFKDTACYARERGDILSYNSREIERVNGHGNVEFMFEGSISHFRRMELEEFRLFLEEQLGIARHCINLVNLKPGSIIVVFQIPLSAIKEVKRLLKEGIHHLQKQKVKAVKIEDQDWIKIALPRQGGDASSSDISAANRYKDITHSSVDDKEQELVDLKQELQNQNMKVDRLEESLENFERENIMLKKYGAEHLRRRHHVDITSGNQYAVDDIGDIKRSDVFNIDSGISLPFDKNDTMGLERENIATTSLTRSKPVSATQEFHSIIDYSLEIAKKLEAANKDLRKHVSSMNANAPPTVSKLNILDHSEKSASVAEDTGVEEFGYVITPSESSGMEDIQDFQRNIEEADIEDISTSTHNPYDYGDISSETFASYMVKDDYPTRTTSLTYSAAFESKLKWFTPTRNYMEIQQSELQLQSQLGDKVHKAIHNGSYGRNVTALKTVTLKDKVCKTEVDRLLHELDVMFRIQPHRNVIKLFGCITAAGSLSPSIIMEFAEHGNLYDVLRHRGTLAFDNDLPNPNTYVYTMSAKWRDGLDRHKLTTQQMTFAEHIACGMEHVARSGIIHCKLQASNVFVGDNGVCKIGSFSMAVVKTAEQHHKHGPQISLPIRWTAPESLSNGIVSMESDVWSFGVVLWEIFTLGTQPYDDMDEQTDIERFLQRGGRLEKPQQCSEEMYNIMLDCWQWSRDDRPNFEALARRIQIKSTLV